MLSVVGNEAVEDGMGGRSPRDEIAREGARRIRVAVLYGHDEPPRDIPELRRLLERPSRVQAASGMPKAVPFGAAAITSRVCGEPPRFGGLRTQGERCRPRSTVVVDQQVGS